jgi:hypothetical protein
MPDTSFWVEETKRREARLKKLQEIIESSPQTIFLNQAITAVQGLEKGNEKKGLPRIPVKDILTLIAHNLGYHAEVSISPGVSWHR